MRRSPPLPPPPASTVTSRPYLLVTETTQYRRARRTPRFPNATSSRTADQLPADLCRVRAGGPLLLTRLVDGRRTETGRLDSLDDGTTTSMIGTLSAAASSAFEGPPLLLAETGRRGGSMIGTLSASARSSLAVVLRAREAATIAGTLPDETVSGPLEKRCSTLGADPYRSRSSPSTSSGGPKPVSCSLRITSSRICLFRRCCCSRVRGCRALRLAGIVVPATGEKCFCGRENQDAARRQEDARGYRARPQRGQVRPAPHTRPSTSATPPPQVRRLRQEVPCPSRPERQGRENLPRKHDGLGRAPPGHAGRPARVRPSPHLRAGVPCVKGLPPSTRFRPTVRSPPGAALLRRQLVGRARRDRPPQETPRRDPKVTGLQVPSEVLVGLELAF